MPIDGQHDGADRGRKRLVDDLRHPAQGGHHEHATTQERRHPPVDQGEE